VIEGTTEPHATDASGGKGAPLRGRLNPRRLGPTCGAEIRDVDLAADLNDAIHEEIEQALLEHVVVCIRGQSMAPADFVALGRRFGALQPHVLSQYHHPDHAEIMVLSNVVVDGRPIGMADGGSYWHSDLSYMDKPAKATLLHALEVPDTGGDTRFIDCRAAYDALSDEMKKRLEALRAVHNYAYGYETRVTAGGTRQPLTEEQRRATPDAVHPVVRTHPDSGRKALYINPGFTVRILDMDETESGRLKAALFDHMIRPEFMYTHTWQPGDLLIWDNRCSMHQATGGYPPEQHRTIYRLTVSGTKPF